MAHKFAGLCTRGIGVLIANNFHTKAEVVKRLKEDPYSIKEAPNCGKKTFSEICAWAGVQDTTPPQRCKRPSPNAIYAAIRLLQEHGYTVKKPNVK